ncbi:MarR family protein [Nonomuraea solani]|uniref:MarR family protein n=1 Tax=Nonomuraea solani TaxID=1144553 RepID=A0A1H6EYZ8_9ACTN|nr:helix-turn-helix domain-containing protein [Nonomuraea solani]SEH02079.1 MarR family protein [Nonomuraea solani]
MSGGRLTQQDRRHIATGLAEGLGYAEIARRLNRPTSTVSREVIRNGGAGGYLADRAHQAAERRARRRKPKPITPARATTAAYGRDPEAVRAFEEHFVDLLVQTGLPRMMSRVLTCLYGTDSGVVTAKELAQRLRVSPASVSTAIAYLEEQELVKRERDPRGRRERYAIDDDVWYRAFLASVRRNLMVAEVARTGIEIYGAGTPAGARLELVSRFLNHTSQDMIQAAEHWRRVLATPPTPDRHL